MVVDRGNFSHVNKGTKLNFLSLQIDSVQGEAFDTMIQNNGTVVFQSGERINIPATLEIIWEVNFSL